MPADQPVTEIKDLRPSRLDDASSHTHQAALVTEHDHRIATDDELVSRELLKLESFA